MNIRDLLNFKSTERSIQDQLFNQILVIILIVSVTNIILNLLIQYPFEANYKWVVMLFVTGLVNKYKNHALWLRFPCILFIILFIVPLGWYNSGAYSNNVIAYVFLCSVAVSFLFSGWQRLFFISLLVTMMCGFITIEYLYPDFLPVHTPELAFYDRIIQIPMSLLVVFLMLRQFSITFYEKNTLLNILNAKLENMAYQDELTQVNNRAYIFEKYRHSIETDQHFVSLMVDLDNFKNVNDFHGHQMGDRLLREIGELLKTHFKDDGHIARYGGDEFIIMLHLDLETVTRKLNHFVHQFNLLDVVKKTGATLSGGYGVFEHDSLDEHLRDVDVALYKAKKSGKNKIIQMKTSMNPPDYSV
ncbi:GGDEF domain-containing protein [Petrocella sp. FN5]|uniref:GGDEF domain-containing protein n=1 Tax=Petrocella sp. FN5 TaxID=3032002 RepID=UPI0023D9E2AF|nr:GGDEF domain-containing protein [Petrocella sp. FN5]MDF1617891.1 GGDEF domain-containing protein [Petrocella sp. FN5]